MYKLFAAAQAIEFSAGCHARCSSLVVKSNGLPFASTPGLSDPPDISVSQCKNIRKYYKKRGEPLTNVGSRII